MSVDYLLPSLVGNCRAGVPPRTLITAEECAGPQNTEHLPAHHTSFPSGPGSVLQISGRGRRGHSGGYLAESSFPWRSIGMTSCKVRTSFTDLFSQKEVASLPWTKVTKMFVRFLFCSKFSFLLPEVGTGTICLLVM